MSDMETTEVHLTDDSAGPKQLRDALKREQEKNAALTAQVMEQIYAEVNLDATKGLGKAIAKEYKGEPTREALLEYAKQEYEWEPPEAPENPVAPAIAAGQSVVDQMNQESTSVMPLSEQELFKKAQAEGDRHTTSRIKADRVAKMLGRQPGT